MPYNKRKIINDPIYGFVSIPHEFIFDLIGHPWFQRLRRIKQLGLTNLVYPGALHTRFHHAIGAMHLMQEAILTLRHKGISISGKEELAALSAILLHDIGHGPFSHSLEHSLVQGINHEKISSLIMDRLNKEFKGRLGLAIEIFNNRYKKTFLHQLVSSQLDMDRMDYLKRDSFFTGVSEGVISSDRIIKMLNVAGNNLVVEHKGIYSIEKFLIARRLMYWQVYLHKTVLSAETLLVNILTRARELSVSGRQLFATPSLARFLRNNYSQKDFGRVPELLGHFCKLDDNDIMASIKVWSEDEDKILARLCSNLLDRKLFRLVIRDKPVPAQIREKIIDMVSADYGISRKEAGYFVVNETVNNSAYISTAFNINILMNDGSLVDVADASDLLNLKSLSKTVTKHYICYPKDILPDEKP